MDTEKKYELIAMLDQDIRHLCGLLVCLYHKYCHPPSDPTELDKVNAMIARVSDVYHTSYDLYEVRHLIFVMLAENVGNRNVWRARRPDRGVCWPGWFILGIFPHPNFQITLHIPMEYWDRLSGIPTYDKNPHYDGHNHQDVIQRLTDLLNYRGPISEYCFNPNVY